MSIDSANTRETPRRSSAWPVFSENLAKTLAQLEEDQFLILSVKRSNRFVQFAGQGSFGLRCEVVSNEFLSASDKLKPHQIQQLLGIGWQDPTGTLETSTPERDPDGSPNFYMDCPAPQDSRAIADLCVSTLIDAFEIPYPGQLEYQGFDTDGNGIEFVSLGLKRAPPRGSGSSLGEIAPTLLGIIRDISGNATLDFDEDGDILLLAANTAVFVRLTGYPARVAFHSPLAVDVADSPDLLPRLNSLNSVIGPFHLFAVEGGIIAATAISATPLVREQVAEALAEFCEQCEGLGEVLRFEFGGKSLFGEPMPSTSKH